MIIECFELYLFRIVMSAGGIAAVREHVAVLVDVEAVVAGSESRDAARHSDAARGLRQIQNSAHR